VACAGVLVAAADPVGASLADLHAIAQRLKEISQIRYDSELADITVALMFNINVVELSWQLTEGPESFILTTQAYADRAGISQRTAQRLCRTRKLPAIMAEDGTWRISNV